MVLLAGMGIPEKRRMRRSRILLHDQDIVLHLKGKLVGIPIGAPAPVGQPLHPAFLVTIEDPVAVLREIPNSLHSSATNCSLSSITEHSFHGMTSSPKGKKCNLCVRCDLLPMCRVAQQTV